MHSTDSRMVGGRGCVSFQQTSSAYAGVGEEREAPIAIASAPAPTKDRDSFMAGCIGEEGGGVKKNPTSFHAAFVNTTSSCRFRKITLALILRGAPTQ